MRAKEEKEQLKSLTADELIGRIHEYRRELFTLRVGAHNVQPKDKAVMTILRKNIARALTYLRQR